MIENRTTNASLIFSDNSFVISSREDLKIAIMYN